MSSTFFEISSTSVSKRLPRYLKVATPFLQHKCRLRSSCMPLLPTVALSVVLLTGCGSAGILKMNPPPSPTNVVVLLTSTANDRLSKFAMVINNITLTSQSGAQISLFNNSDNFVDFIYFGWSFRTCDNCQYPSGPLHLGESYSWILRLYWRSCFGFVHRWTL